MKLSLLLPTYNRVYKFQELIQYLEKEEIFDSDEIEVIISNNCSTDGTIEFLNGLKKKNLVIYNQENNLGLIGNIRFLTSKATGDFVWILGDNDLYLKGAIDKVLQTISLEPDSAHIFMNYGAVDGTGKHIKEKMYMGIDRVYNDGFEMFYKLSDEVDLGLLMFISANIYRRDIINTVNVLVDSVSETDNLALPLGYSLYAAQYKNVCISEVYVFNEATTPSSWVKQQTLVYSRDMLAMYDCVAKSMNNYKELRSFFMRHLPCDFPEYRYMIRGRKFGKSNYSMMFYKKYYPFKIVIDLFRFPVEYAKYLVHRRKKS